METIRYSDNCVVKNLSNNKTVEAVIMSFVDKKHLNVVINRSIKLSMTWNGRCYEGRAAGLDFESLGPEVKRFTTGIRG